MRIFSGLSFSYFLMRDFTHAIHLLRWPSAICQDPTPEGGGLQFQVSFPENALSGTDCNGLLDGSPILLRTENYATTNRIEMQACSAIGGTWAFLPSPEGRGFSRFFGENRSAAFGRAPLVPTINRNYAVATAALVLGAAGVVGVEVGPSSRTGNTKKR